MRILRTILWIVCVLVLLAIGSVVALYFLVTPESVQSRIQHSFNQTGMTIRTNELPTVRVLPTINISLPSAQLFDEQNRLVAFYRSAHFTVSPLWLAFGQVHIENLLIDGFSLQETDCPTPSSWLKNNISTQTALIDGVTINSVELNNSDISLKFEDKILKLQNLRATVGSPSPQMHAPVAFSSQAQLLPDSLLMDIEGAFTFDLNLASGQMALENLLLKATGTHQGRSFNTQLSSPLTQITAENVYAQTAQLNVGGDPSLGDISLTVAELNITKDALQAPDIYVQYKKGSGAQELAFELRSPIVFDRQQVLSTTDHIQGTLRLPGQTESIPVSGNAKVDWSNEKVQGELFARVHGAPMSLQGESAGFDHPAIKGDVVFGRLELNDFSVFNSLQKAQKTLPLLETDAAAIQSEQVQSEPSESTAVEPNEKPVANNVQTDNANPESDQVIDSESDSATDTNVATADPGTSETKANEPEAIAQNVNSEVSDTAVQNEGTPSVTTDEPTGGEADFSFLNLFDFEGSLVVGELKTGPVKLVQLKSDMSVQNGVLRLPKAQAVTYEGKTELDVQLNAQGHWSVRYSGESINLSSLLADTNGNSKMGGVMNIQANLYGDGFLQETLNGQIGFSVARAKIFGFNLDEAVKNLRAFKEPQQNSELFTQTDHIEGIATIHDGLANVERLQINFGSLRTQGSAKVTLDEQELTGQLTGSNLSGLKLTFNLGNQWYNPTVSLDVEKIRHDNNLIPKAEPAEPKSSSWDKLKNFFRDRF